MLLLPMKKPSLVKKLHKPVYPIVSTIVLVIAVALAIIGLFVVWQQQHQSFSSQQQTQALTNFPTATHSPLSTEPSRLKDIIKTYTSSNLGISFRYDIGSLSDPLPLQVKEVSNKIYLYMGSFNPDGIYVQVLSKDPADNLVTAVRKQFLQGYSEQKCILTVDTSKYSFLSSTYIRASAQPADSSQNYDNVSKTDCPADLIGQAGSSYFLMDIAHPNKFLFFEISGGNFGADKGTWDETVQFLN